MEPELISFGNKPQYVAFLNDSKVFREDTLPVVPVRINDKIKVMTWGADNQMPYNILEMIERDETLITCQQFNAEICYGGGLKLDTEQCSDSVRDKVQEFVDNNDLAALFYGMCLDFKFFGFAVAVVTLTRDGKTIASIERKEAMYCRFGEADERGKLNVLLYANWRNGYPREEEIEFVSIIYGNNIVEALKEIVPKTKRRRFAVVCRIPTADSTYYPIPYYGALFRGKWYEIKQLIGLAKWAKLKNSAPIKYIVEISNKYWERKRQEWGIADELAFIEKVKETKQMIIDFITGAENSGKAIFSEFFINPATGQTMPEIKISKIETDKEGGDWASDLQEAINMICFTMRVHSNLVGSVPGRAGGNNNSGSDKRELYTIAQALQKPYHDILFKPIRLIIKYNGWNGCRPSVSFTQLTTLDKHVDAITTEQ